MTLRERNSSTFPIEHFDREVGRTAYGRFYEAATGVGD